ncbi:MAG: 2,3-bisphosphoglycerate-independent phosphoglycerate mutase [Clostridia bacterium]|nr:2,3-bisphosphoglycerate-independent phosphoglycerate mutase [Clostridia bacterium]
MLIIMDGYGLNEEENGNAVKAAFTPRLDEMFVKYPNTRLNASGLAVGLPEGQMGNSEVGHTNIGAGRVVFQELTRISKDIEDGEFFDNDALRSAVLRAKIKDQTLHVMGLLSDGGVHSHITHLYAILRLAKHLEMRNVAIHCFLDGRDVPPKSAASYIEQLEKMIKKIGVGRIATISGRYYAMDRDNRFERLKLAYDALVYGKGVRAKTAAEAIEASYENDVTDEFVLPCVIGKPQRIEEGDSVIFYNFRPDRAREITRALVDPGFTGFECERLDLNYVCMTQYDALIPNVRIAFPPQSLHNTLGQYISKQGIKQFRIAETEKYAHVTFFLNGGVEAPYPDEERMLIPSPKVATYDLQPRMSAPEVTYEARRHIEMKKYGLIVLNYANCDMVGHTGVYQAAVEAVSCVDSCLNVLVPVALENGYTLMITADHGNCDRMYDTDGSPFTAHTTNPVPLIITREGISLKEGRLCDIAPTLLELMGLPIPKEMTGESLIIKK